MRDMLRTVAVAAVFGGLAACNPHPTTTEGAVATQVTTTSASSSSVPSPSRDYVVATWNVAWATHDAEDSRKFPRNSATWRATGRFAAALGADLVALQEVDGYPVARFLLPADAGYGTWRVPASDAGETQQAILVARGGIPVRSEPDLAAIGTGGLRAGLDSTVTLDGRTLRVLVLHLKAFCNDQPLVPLPPPGDCRRLAEQLPHIAAWIAARRQDGTAYMVLGDFNRSLSKQGDDFLAALKAADPDLHVIAQSDHPSCPAGYGGIDNILLGGPAVRWAVAGSQRGIPLPRPTAGTGRLSDHCPLLVTLRPS